MTGSCTALVNIQAGKNVVDVDNGYPQGIVLLCFHIRERGCYN